MPDPAVNPQSTNRTKEASVSKRSEGIGPGALIPFEGRSVQLVSFERGATERLEALLDTGTGLQRVPIPRFFSEVSDRPPPKPQPGSDPELDSPVLAQLPEHEQHRIEERYRDLLQVKTGSRRGDPEGDRAKGVLSRTYDPARTTQKQRLTAKSQELRDRDVPASSAVQLRRQIKAVERDGIEALIHKNRKMNGQQLADVGEDVLAVVTKLLKTQPGRARPSDKALRTMARAALIEAGITTTISDYKLGIIVGELSRSLDLHHEAKGRERVAMKPDVAYGRRLVSRPGEIVQVDATTTNIHVWDPRLGWVRSTIVTAIDVFTRCIVALRVVTGSVTSRDVAMLLWDIGRPTVTRSGYPYELVHHHGMPTLVTVNREPDIDHYGTEVMGTKPAFTPSAIVMDHGREFDCEHLISACARIDVDVIFCPPRAAHAKGVVESFHNTLREIQSLLAAYKGANVNNHPKGVEELAPLTAHDLRDALWEYVLEIYHWREHDGLAALHDSETPLCPAGVFEAYLEAGGEVTVPKDPYRLIQLLTSKKCIVHPYGINIEGRVYNNASLVALRPRMARGVGTPAKPLLVFYDRWDVSRVYTRHPLTHEWMCIPRAGETREARMPCSDLFDKAIRKQLIRDQSRPLSSADRSVAAAQFVNRWAPERFADRNEARIRAVEAGRAHDYAHDLADASPEFRELAFGNKTDDTPIIGELVTASADSDEILDADLVEDEEEIDFDALEDYDPTTDFPGLGLTRNTP